MKTDNTPVTGIILETRKSNADELHPVKLRVTFKGDRKYYTLKGLDKKTLYMSSDDFDRISTSTNLKPLKIHLTEIEKKAMKVIEEMAVFSFESFESVYFSKPKDDKDLFSILNATGKKMREAGRISTAVSFECALKSLKEFTGKEKFPFAAANVKFFKDYEKWMLTPKV
ncbi:MAG: phage integrase SAM-like domain-containing protein, partial [Bacteroidota bacterium]